MAQISQLDLLLKIQDLQARLDEADQLIEAIKAGEVDAFAISNENEHEIYTLESGDYAYRVLIEMFGEGAINVTEDGLIVYTNPYFFNLLKLPYEKVVGSSILDFIHKDSKEEFNRLFKECLSGNSKGEICLGVNNSDIPVYISMTSLRPQLATVGIIITDLTKQKESEKIILEYQKDLESKNVKLLQSNEELAAFTYVASHDLQEPLRKIQTFADRVLEREAGNLSEKGKDHFNRMNSAARRMQVLIENLLSYSRTNTQDRKFENTDLNKLVEEVQKDLKEDIQQKKAAIQSSGLGEIRVITFQFRQLFNNLIGNSLKFSSPAYPPQITISEKTDLGKNLSSGKLLPDKKYHHLRISDNGIGFEQEYSEKIFELFQRLHGRTEYSGTGIGLAIVKKIVENHNGVITATSELHKGATFDIYIPAG